jgi:hypothetical protein
MHPTAYQFANWYFEVHTSNTHVEKGQSFGTFDFMKIVFSQLKACK